jgi:hypothetical protein
LKKYKKMKHYLFTTYYEASNPERAEEYDYCIEKNKVASFDEIFLLVEEKDMVAAARFGVNVVPFLHRPTFKDFFDFMGKGMFADSINIVANTDIFFMNMQEIDANAYRLTDGCFALTRYDFKKYCPTELFDRVDSQDTWVFLGNKLMPNIKNVDFCMGIGGCDNRLAHELKDAGYEVLNPSRSIKTFHLHNVNIRTFNQNDPRVPPPYLLLPPTF